MTDANLSAPYTWRSFAELYRSLGWTGTLPLRHQTKWPPPSGYTGWEGVWPTPSDLERWESAEYGYGEQAGMALRLGPNVVGIDVDAYGDKVGARSLAELVGQYGDLPPTWRSTSRVDGVSAIRFYRVPPGLAWPGQAGRDIETIHFGHRYAVVYPSIHPSGSPYLWYDPEGRPSAPPRVGDLPMLPDAWIEGLTNREEATPARKAKVDTDAWDWVAEHQKRLTPCRCVREFHPELASAAERAFGSAHDAVRDRLVPAVRLAERGCSGVLWLLNDAQMAFVESVDREGAEAEFDRMLAGAVAIVVADPAKGTCQDFGLVVGDVEYLPAPPPELGSELADVDHDTVYSRVDWGTAWEADETEDWIVEPLLARGRSVALYSQPKVGKSLLTLEVAAAIATGRPVLGTDAEPATVLYVDMENNIAGDIVPRLKRLGYGPNVLHRLIYLSFPTLGFLDTPSGAAGLLAAVEHYDAAVVVVDTVSRLVQGEENANDTWLNVYRYLGAPLKAARVAVLRLDHSGKDETKGMRGGSAKYGDVDAVWRMTRVSDEVFSLDLEASRMPVAEHHLTIKRSTGARLAHSVDPGGKAASWKIKVEERVALLDELGLPNDAGERIAKEAIKAAGHEVQLRVTREAIKNRQARGSTFSQPGGGYPQAVEMSDSSPLYVVSLTDDMGSETTSSQAPDDGVTTPPLAHGVSAGQGRRHPEVTTPDDIEDGLCRRRPPTLEGGRHDDADDVSACVECGEVLERGSYCETHKPWKAASTFLYGEEDGA